MKTLHAFAWHPLANTKNTRVALAIGMALVALNACAPATYKREQTQDFVAAGSAEVVASRAMRDLLR
jgi:hypothetical protein